MMLFKICAYRMCLLPLVDYILLTQHMCVILTLFGLHEPPTAISNGYYISQYSSYLSGLQ